MQATEIFHCELPSKLPGLKRKAEGEGGQGGRAKLPCSQPALLSPPLYKPVPAPLAMVPGYPHDPAQDTGQANTSQEDEWKNIKVVRNGQQKTE